MDIDITLNIKNITSINNFFLNFNIKLIEFYYKKFIHRKNLVEVNIKDYFIIKDYTFSMYYTNIK